MVVLHAPSTTKRKKKTFYYGLSEKKIFWKTSLVPERTTFYSRNQFQILNVPYTERGKNTRTNKTQNTTGRVREPHLVWEEVHGLSRDWERAPRIWKDKWKRSKFMTVVWRMVYLTSCLVPSTFNFCYSCYPTPCAINKTIYVIKQEDFFPPPF